MRWYGRCTFNDRRISFIRFNDHMNFFQWNKCVKEVLVRNIKLIIFPRFPQSQNQLLTQQNRELIHHIQILVKQIQELEVKSLPTSLLNIATLICHLQKKDVSQIPRSQRVLPPTGFSPLPTGRLAGDFSQSNQSFQYSFRIRLPCWSSPGFSCSSNSWLSLASTSNCRWPIQRWLQSSTSRISERRAISAP